MADTSSGGRDLVGYGANPPAVPWPNGARLAVSVVVNYEEGSEYSQAMGDATQEGLTEFGNYPLPEGYRNLAMESMFEYGSRAGVWRILRLFEETGIKSTFYACAVAFEQNPEVARAVVAGGHEVCSHGYRWEEVFRLSREEEREHIRLAVESFERTCGKRPVGWYCRFGPSVHTRELVVEEGGFLYDSDAYNDDLPYLRGGRRQASSDRALHARCQRLLFLDGARIHHRRSLPPVSQGQLRHALRGIGDHAQDDVHRAARPHDRPPRPDRRTRPLHRARASARWRLVRDARRNRPPLARSGGVGKISRK